MTGPLRAQYQGHGNGWVAPLPGRAEDSEGVLMKKLHDNSVSNYSVKTILLNTYLALTKTYELVNHVCFGRVYVCVICVVSSRVNLPKGRVLYLEWAVNKFGKKDTSLVFWKLFAIEERNAISWLFSLAWCLRDVFGG